MEKKLKFKEGDKVKVIATIEQLKEIGIGETWYDELFNEEIYVKNLVVKHVRMSFRFPYVLSNNFLFPEQYLDYAD